MTTMARNIERLMEEAKQNHSYVCYASDAHLDYLDLDLDWVNPLLMVTLTVDIHWTFQELILVEKLRIEN